MKLRAYWKVSAIAFVLLFLLFMLGGVFSPTLGEITKWIYLLTGAMVCVNWASEITTALWKTGDSK